MDGTRSQQPVARWRIWAGIALFAVLLYAAAQLIPPYFENYEYQQDLNRTVASGKPDEVLVAEAVNQAARRGLPVRTGDVHVTRSASEVRIDILYVHRIDLPLYTVDLHFHPSAAAGNPSSGVRK